MRRRSEGEPVKDCGIDINNSIRVLMISHHMAAAVTAETPVMPHISGAASQTVAAFGNPDIFGPEQCRTCHWRCRPASAHRAVTDQLRNGITGNLDFHFTTKAGSLLRRHIDAPDYVFVQRIRSN